MPQQLIYTSSPRGLIAGRSGYCTVACSEGMREALQLRLEQISYFEHLEAAGTRQPSICAYRTVDIRGSRFHVLTRIVDAGLDFTKRTNFIAHHLVFQPQEIAGLPSPPVLFLHWNRWQNLWQGEPQYLKNEDWGNLMSLGDHKYNPAEHWAALTGDAVNAAALLDSRSQESFGADGLDEQRTLPLLAESLALLLVRPANTGASWQQGFTTFLQERDEAADFRWRLVYTGTPAHARLVTRGAAIKPLAELRCAQCDEVTAIYARTGPQPLQITQQPESQSLSEGHDVLLSVATRGVPPASRFQWYTCDRSGRRDQPVAGATGPELRLAGLGKGVSRYLVVVENNSGGSVESSAAIISVQEHKAGRTTAAAQPATPLQIKRGGPASPLKTVKKKSLISVDTEDDAGWEAPEPEADEEEKSYTKVIVAAVVAVLLVAAAVLLFGIFHGQSKDPNNLSNSPDAGTNTPTGGEQAKTNSVLADLKTTETKAAQIFKSFLFLYQSSISEKEMRKLTNDLETANNYIASQSIALNSYPAKLNEALKTSSENLTKSQNGLAAASSELEKYLQEHSKLKSDSQLGKDAGYSSRANAVKADQNDVAANQQSYNRAVQDRGEETETMASMKANIKAWQVSRDSIREVINGQHDLEKNNKAQNQDLVGRLKDICTFTNGQQLFYQMREYGPQRTVAVHCGNFPSSSGNLPLTDGRNFGSLNFDWNSDKFSVSGYQASTDFSNLAGPILISFYSDTNSAAQAEFILWPARQPFIMDAGCDENGHISITTNLELLQSLKQLQGAGSVLEMQFKYMDGLCSNNFSEIQGEYDFSALNQLLKAHKPDASDWLAQQKSAKNLAAFRDQVCAKLNIKTSHQDQVFDELNNLCTKIAGENSADASGPRLFEFENTDADVRREAYARLLSGLDKKSMEPPAFDTNDCQQVAQFLTKHTEFTTLDQVQSALAGLVPQGTLDVAQLKATIILKRQQEPLEPVLVNLRFLPD